MGALGWAVIAYCRIGERSSHTWFVLKYLLGLDKVVNFGGLTAARILFARSG
jgi:thiosulfate/3-mercaptopyruvate sulfurtransferase